MNIKDNNCGLVKLTTVLALLQSKYILKTEGGKSGIWWKILFLKLFFIYYYQYISIIFWQVRFLKIPLIVTPLLIHETNETLCMKANERLHEP